MQKRSSPLVEKEAGVFLYVKINPGARHTQIQGIGEHPTGPLLKISLVNPPEKGKANQALIRFLSTLFDMPVRAIEICQGETDRLKILKLSHAFHIIHDKMKKFIE